MKAVLPKVTHAEFVAGATVATGLPAPGFAEIAFAGRSNVGKSTLLNNVLQRQGLVRTSSKPGATRQLNIFEGRTHDDFRAYFVDLPGYGYAKVSKTEAKSWGPMIEGYLNERVSLRALVLLVEIRRGVEDEERALLDFMRARPTQTVMPVRTIVVATKIDKLSKAQQKPALGVLQKAAGFPVLGVSGETGDGVAELWAAMRRACVLQA